MPRVYTRRNPVPLSARSRRIFASRKYRLTYRKKQMLSKIRRPIPLSGFPKSKLVKLRYVETVNVTDSTLTGANYVFSCNSLYDPNTTGTGHQPYGFDQWGAIYNHYKVYGSKIKVIATNAVTPQSGHIIGIKVDDNGTISTNVNTIMESQDSNYTVIVAQSNPQMLYHKWSLKKSMPSKPDDFGAIVSANPADQMYFNVYMRTADGVSALGTITLQVQIDYVVLFSERQDFNGS